MFLLGFIGCGWTEEKTSGDRFGVYDTAFSHRAVWLQEKVSFAVSDPELISHRPVLEFHTPESSHDPGLAAQARPGPQGPAILFHMGIHTYWQIRNSYTNSKYDTHTKSAHALDVHSQVPSLLFSHIDTYTHTLAQIHIRYIPRNPQRGKRRVWKREGEKGKKKVAFIVFRPFISSRLEDGGSTRGLAGSGGFPLHGSGGPLPPPNILSMQEFLATQLGAHFQKHPFTAHTLGHTHMCPFPMICHEASFQ